MSSNKSNYRKRAIVFDVETTGLLPKKDPITKKYPPFASWPHILQLSFAIYNVDTWSIERVYNSYVKVAPEIVIEPIITELTGITRQIVDEHGIPIGDVLHEFYLEYLKCDVIVAHNIDFDKEMVLLEFRRLSMSIEDRCPFYGCVFNSVYNEAHGIEIYCTMSRGRERCNILRDYKPKAPCPTIKIPNVPIQLLTPSGELTDIFIHTAELMGLSTFLGDESITQTAHVAPKPQYKKAPKLSELYLHLFGEVPENLHNSLVDTLVCLRCFVKMRFKVEISKEKIFTHVIIN